MRAERLPFIKLVAAGNDFVFLDQSVLEQQQITREELRILVPQICARHFGVGGDGVIALESVDQPTRRVRWHFLNADGSEAEMCGNAARCVGALLALRQSLGEGVILETLAGSVEVSAQGADYSVSMPPVKAMQWPLHLELVAHLQEQVRLMGWVNTGVPHVVVQISQKPELSAWHLAATFLRRHATLGAGGANVTLVWPRPLGGVNAVTFERGVEDFTLACGTGAVAAAYAAAQEQKANAEIMVEMPGGLLRVELSQDLSLAKLKGPAQVVFEGHYYRRTNG